MNKDRKKKLSDLFQKIEKIKGDLEDICAAEQADVDAFMADISDGVLDIEESCDALERACDNLNEVILFN
ncbi:hypothetical protein Bresa_00631|uniref:Uncharacterized protein n=1 Tax=Brenneria salicis ATCC 15712 = DSM 30166 TaxID=714314 RepID=A0A366I7E2_9GAMM|nr:hypothetical protein [Brenneria salicis]NMN90555.1 hypothetical protein [Brenneria salicis ATCC 15712 = DSM 30166]RBP64886.1 hypothetical protein DES54_106111 [Brenneria salicis ATCC 15712 = DSM 30166]RLM31602.1 hypothetical protein BHG07_04920 [Brenneria salicis ATCC 15712 = DSM 30166]